MELKKYVHILIKRLWILLLLPLVAGAASAYVSLYVLDRVYESNTTLYVINKTGDPQYALDYSQLLAGEYLVKDYRELVRSRTVTGAVIEELKLRDMSNEALASMISVDSKNDTRIIEIRVQDTDPKMARDIADKVSTVFIKKVMELMDAENVSIVDRAETPKAPVEPNPVMNVAVAVFAALMAAAGIVFLLEYLDDTIKSAEDVEKYLGTTLLGTIPVME